MRLDVADHVGDAPVARQRHQEVNVDLDAARGEQRRLSLADDAADDRVQLDAQRLTDALLAVLGAEDEMAVEGGQGLGHRLSLPEAFTAVPGPSSSPAVSANASSPSRPRRGRINRGR